MGFDFEAAAAKARTTQKDITENAKSSGSGNKIVRLCISMSEDTNAKLTAYSKKTGISKSSLIQHWIHENCE